MRTSCSALPSCATGFLTGARFGRVTLEAYQLAPVLRLLAKPRPALLIADDVGLGKTIEAGLAVLELMARSRASRILVVTPPGLMDQWREELLDKFGLEFAQPVGCASARDYLDRLPEERDRAEPRAPQTLRPHHRGG